MKAPGYRNLAQQPSLLLNGNFQRFKAFQRFERQISEDTTFRLYFDIKNVFVFLSGIRCDKESTIRVSFCNSVEQTF